jgi:hypothetical protein
MTDKTVPKTKLELVEASLRNNSDIAIVQRKAYTFSPRSLSGGFFVQKIDIIVVPKNGTYTDNDQKVTLVNLIPKELVPTNIQEHEITNGADIVGVKIATLYIDEAVGILSRQETVQIYDKLLRGDLSSTYALKFSDMESESMKSSYAVNRRIRITIYPNADFVNAESVKLLVPKEQI